VDLEVWHSARHDRHVNVRISECVKVETNQKFRLFRIVTAEQQIKDEDAAGMPVHEAFRKNADLCDFSILWAENYDEYWVFPKDVLFQIRDTCGKKSGKLKPASDSVRAEIDLDIVDENGVKLTEVYAEYLYNFEIIIKALLKK
jgi:hypothetical protein